LRERINIGWVGAPLPSSLVSIAAGVIDFCGGIIILLLLLPRVTPYEILSCTEHLGVSECSGGVNPVYGTFFITSMTGIALAFYGFFGRDFILGPLFTLGMVLIAFGSAGIVLGYLGLQYCKSYSLSVSCLAYHPETFALVVMSG